MNLDDHNHEENIEAALRQLERCVRERRPLACDWPSVFRYLETLAIQERASSPSEVAEAVLREFFMPNALGKWDPPKEPIALYFQTAVQNHCGLERCAASASDRSIPMR